MQKERKVLPILLKTDWLVIYTYPLFMGLAWGVGQTIGRNIYLKYDPRENHFRILFWLVFLFAFVGSKLFFILFSAHDNALFIDSTFWLGGGFVFYGGAIFGIAAAFILTIVFKFGSWRALFAAAPALPFAHAVGRLGCFLTGCCYGKETKVLPFFHAHPVQLYESISLFAIGFFLLKIKNIEMRVPYYLMSYAVIRFLLEFFRDDAIRGVYWGGLSSSQHISLVIFFVGLIIYYFLKRWRKWQSQSSIQK